MRVKIDVPLQRDSHNSYPGLLRLTRQGDQVHIELPDSDRELTLSFDSLQRVVKLMEQS